MARMLRIVIHSGYDKCVIGDRTSSRLGGSRVQGEKEALSIIRAELAKLERGRESNEKSWSKR